MNPTIYLKAASKSIDQHFWEGCGWWKVGSQLLYKLHVPLRGGDVLSMWYSSGILGFVWEHRYITETTALNKFKIQIYLLIPICSLFFSTTIPNLLLVLIEEKQVNMHIPY